LLDTFTAWHAGRAIVCVTFLRANIMVGRMSHAPEAACRSHAAGVTAYTCVLGHARTMRCAITDIIFTILTHSCGQSL
jgi:hypothetical protein